MAYHYAFPSFLGIYFVFLGCYCTLCWDFDYKKCKILKFSSYTVEYENNVDNAYDNCRTQFILDAVYIEIKESLLSLKLRER